MSESVVISKLAKRIETLTEEKRNLHNLNHRLAQSTIVYEQRAMIADQKLETAKETLQLQTDLLNVYHNKLGEIQKIINDHPKHGYALELINRIRKVLDDE